MQYKNTRTRFGLVAIAFHWIMSVLVIGMLILGLYMVTLDAGLEKTRLYGWHKEYGVIILVLALLRLGWRLQNVNPVLNLPPFERISARLVHWTFYLLMLAMPFSGWLMSSAAGRAVSFFGLFTLPSLINPNPDAGLVFRNAHHYLGYTLIALILLHTAAALKHHFYDGDDILRRML